MKKYALVVLICLFVTCFCSSCRHDGDDHNISLTLKESGGYYKIIAEYPRQNTAKVERYMDQKLGDKSNIGFTHTRIDAEITLDDGTRFYLDKSVGSLELKLDKTKNSYASYQKIKSFGEGLKQVLQE
jgi:hypothetical protein